MMPSLRLGIVGLSEGNGHPYSWSAIFNGYDVEQMASCPFPVIPEYLSRQSFPEDAIAGVRVTHIWTQDKRLSMHIAKASCIDVVVDQPSDMLGHIDALLLARDDAESHYNLALPFLESGLPLYIDKPLALSEKDAVRLLNKQVYPGQIFSCSALRYAEELKMTKEIERKVGELKHIIAMTPKYWDTYAMHVIDPALQLFGIVDRVEFESRLIKAKDEESRCLDITLEDERRLTLYSLADTACPISFTCIGSKGTVILTFRDTFSAFKAALRDFVKVIETRVHAVEEAHLLNCCRILERGRAYTSAPLSSLRGVI